MSKLKLKEGYVQRERARQEAEAKARASKRKPISHMERVILESKLLPTPVGFFIFKWCPLCHRGLKHLIYEMPHSHDYDYWECKNCDYEFTKEIDYYGAGGMF